ncbi:MAG: transposase [Candidatus Wallbacteria bacterium]|nr:transposase [Candidatus Wallbacteria bacterium]
MGRELRIEFDHAFYHVISRGNTRSRIFKKDSDRIKFLEYLQQIHKKFKVVIHAYCLMGNHYHLLMETPKGNLSKVMHTLNTSYTNYYNYRNGRTGHLFSGRYKAILVEKNSYAQILSAYIHLNPVEAKLVEEPEAYEWSSYKYYSNESMVLPDFMETGFILGYFGKCRKKAILRYVKYVEDRIDIAINPFKDVKADSVLGSDEYLDWIRENAEAEGWVRRPVPKLEKLYEDTEIEARIRKWVSANDKTGLEKKLDRKILIYFLREKANLELRQLGSEFKMTEAGICVLVKRFKAKLLSDEKLQHRLKKIEKELMNVKC